MGKALFTALFLSIFFLFSCQSEKKRPLTKDEVIAQKIEDKVNRWKESTRNKCTEDVLKAAIVIVDSILIARARLDVDSIPKPEKPIKPIMPTIKKLKDTLPIAPILDSLPE